MEVKEMTTQAQDRGVTTPEKTAAGDADYDKARERAKALQGVYVHLFVFAVVNGALFLINWATRGPQGDWWFYWPLIGWGVAVVIHLATTFLPVFSPEWVERRAARKTGQRPANR
jgi:hypothetical protein